MKFGDVLWIGAKALVGGALAYGLDWGVSYAPIDSMWQTVLFGGVGIVGGVVVTKWVDAPVGAGILAGTGTLLIGRVRNQIALRKLAKKEEKKEGENEGGAVYRFKEAGRQGIPFLRSGRPWGSVGQNAGAVGPARVAAAPTLPSQRYPTPGETFKAESEAGQPAYRPPGYQETAKARAPVTPPGYAPGAGRVYDFHQQREAGASIYMENGQRYGPHSWVTQFKRGAEYRDEAGRVIRVRSAHNIHRRVA